MIFVNIFIKKLLLFGILSCLIFIIDNNNNKVLGDEINIQIFAKKPINIISDKFISYSIEPKNLLSLCGNPSVNFTKMIKQLGPAYFKIAGSTTENTLSIIDEELHKKSHDNEKNIKNTCEINSNQWKSINDWLSYINFIPIVALDYNSKLWKARNVIQTLGITNNLGIKKCLWQLGSNFNNDTGDTISYIDDLTTLRTIVDAFAEHKNEWGILGADLSSKSGSVEDIRSYSEMSQHMIDAIGWKGSSINNQFSNEYNENSIFDDKEPILKNLIKGNLPIWLNLNHSIGGVGFDYKTDISIVKDKIFANGQSNNKCTKKCLENGLNWAQTLGNTARSGFKVIYRPIDKTDMLLEKSSLTYYITVLYKKLMGEKVFDTKVMNVDKKFLNIYTHCSKNISGSFTVMGINPSNQKIQITTKMPTKYSGSEVQQYILTVATGSGGGGGAAGSSESMVLLNGDPIPDDHSNIEPYTQIKRPNRPIHFILPAFSIGFWVLPLANLKECLIFNENHYKTDEYYESAEDEQLKNSKGNIDQNNNIIGQRQKTSAELLLQQLILEIINRDSMQMKFIPSSSSSPSPSPPPSDELYLKKHEINKKDLKRIRRYISDNNDNNQLFNDIQMNNDGNYIKSYDFLAGKSMKRDYRNTINSMYYRNKRNNHISMDDEEYQNHENSIGKREKRQIGQGLSRLFEKFDLKKTQFYPKKSAPTTGTSSLQSSSVTSTTNNKFKFGIPAIRSNMHNVFRANSDERNFFKSSENKNLPKGDVYFEIGGGPDDGIPLRRNYDGNNFADYQKRMEMERHRGQSMPPKDSVYKDVPDDIDLRRVPDQFFEYVYSDKNNHQSNLKPESKQYNNNYHKNINNHHNNDHGHGEIWEHEIYPSSIINNQHTINNIESKNGNHHHHHQQQPILHQNDVNLGYVLKELEPTKRKNYENLQKSKQDISNYYILDENNEQQNHLKNINYINQPNPVVHDGIKHNNNYQHESNDDDDEEFFQSKRKRRSAIDSKFNDVIEKRLNEYEEKMNTADDDDSNDDDQQESVSKNNQLNNTKLKFLDKLFRLIDNIDHVDDLGILHGSKKFHDELNNVENIIKLHLAKKSMKPINNNNNNNKIDEKMLTNAIRKKCKILSMNVEQRCVHQQQSEAAGIIIGGYGKSKRDAKYINEDKMKKSLKLLLNKSKKSLGRIKRNAIWNHSSWEVHNTNENLIPKELKSGGDTNSNNVVPSAYIDKHDEYISSLLPSSATKQQHSTLTILHKSINENGVTELQEMKIAAPSKYIIEPSKSINPSESSRTNKPIHKIHSNDQHILSSSIINENNLDDTIIIDNNLERNKREKTDQSPRFMKVVTQSVDAFMEMLNRNVAGWWTMMS